MLNRKTFKKIRNILALSFALTLSTSTFTYFSANAITANYSVSQSISNQDNSQKIVKGYIVGEPIANNKILTNNFENNFALAIADSPSETDVSKMIYVQIPKNLRNEFGLSSNPNIKGNTIEVTGTLTAYFAHSGIKNVSDITNSDGSNTQENNNNTNTNINNPTHTTNPDKNNNNTNSEYDKLIDIDASYDDTYYKTALNKKGESLKSELHNIIDDHKELSYKAVWDALRHTDEDPNNPNNVILLYTNRSQNKFENGALVNNWNREHVWAKSHGDFGTRPGAGTDLHHLRPSDVSVNSSRSNLDFDIGGSNHSEATECKFDRDSWEPRDEVKGDIARMLFYMAVRYEGDSGEPDLELNNSTNTTKDPFLGKLDRLIEWNHQDPVDDFEKRRNEIIFKNYQYNRNPFIDHPEWVDLIWE